jgi:acetyl esterase
VNAPSIRWFDSYDDYGSGYFLEMASVEWYLDQYLPRRADVANAYAVPLCARRLEDLPPATVLTAGFDPLADEGAAYADRLAAEGTPVEHLHYDGQIHGFVSLYEDIDEGRAAIDDAIARLGDAFAE